MAELFRMPAVAADAATAVLSAWQVAEGASFTKDDALVSIETDKAEVDVSAERDGVLLKALYEAGVEIEVGDPIAVLGTAGEQTGDLDALLVELGVAAPAEARQAVRRDVPEEPAVPAPSAAPALSLAPASGEPDRGGRIFSSPLARRLAREAGLGIEALTGTGPGGRIVRRDVEAAVAAGRAQATEPPAPPAPAPVPQATTPAAPASAAGTGDHEDIPHTRMRRAIARRLTESKQHTPHFYLRATCAVDELLALRQRINAVSPVKISVNDLLIKAVATAHTQVPEMNAVWQPDAVRRFRTVDVSVAIATDTGLVTPVLRGIENLSVSAIATRTRAFAERARSGGLVPADLEGGSITVSNLGMYGVEEFAAIINPPQAAILAIGAARDEAVVRDGAVTAAKVLGVVLSVDHRPVDGAVAARWLAAFTEAVENPVRLVV
ncbi:2-oxo acid dehydrogenase subunit E2 [Streptomyces sp. NBC_00264]|uniref:2-oxo acid dehydrogenase subunit E2 n=1 Tax=unclassified Streptomyces TaxID=2593676 RepID=UPI000F5BB39B|nr:MULTISPECIES: 2-oxo acid dehydrogenase subunit E2 [unclassified Streptomyces]WSG49092.1 2-oxo acid dehydrogenase subunit E2 [Streptomyces sp. NBC_01732]WSW99744.1 2-oxo acid dehydrogenase subunit E2 [Streptomyces sp. NBC_00987]MCX4398489.1 2-oxo acid dehydrogenase subunit E2 [Streptomyces sp. NBC_01767]MCX5158344.1 2-oxo acid dehydrogenase subunit E2 [Streptomyces sp. NBC_00305]MCX5216867.1 2-oxo acid dehydrogenase subunit E2 [Streptomyces sp. NBC_00264]